MATRRDILKGAIYIPFFGTSSWRNKGGERVQPKEDVTLIDQAWFDAGNNIKNGHYKMVCDIRINRAFTINNGSATLDFNGHRFYC